MKNRYDCIIAGFGTAGAVAAIAAGRKGASVLVLERGTCPGGTHTAGGIGYYYIQKPLGLMAELDEKCRRLAEETGWTTHLCEPKKHIIEQEAAKAGVEIRYEAVISACHVENGLIRRIHWTDPAGEHCAEAACFIDATGDAQLCELAGARLASGRPSDGQFQPFTNSMLLTKNRDMEIRNFDAGRIDQYREPEYSQTMLETTLVHLCDDFSSRRGLIAPSELPGVREGKYLLPENPYTLEEFFRTHGACEEPIFHAYTNIDTHANDIALESDLFGEWMINCSMWGFNLGFPVPRRVLSASGAGVKNLLAAGRHLAVDHDLGHALRMNALMGALGEVAGTIAALAARKNVLPDDVPYADFADTLPLAPETMKENGRIRNADPETIREELDSDHPGVAQWSARETIPAETLVRWMNEAPEGSRLRRHAALALALKRNSAGIGELCKMVRERDPYTPSNSRKYNHKRGYAALFSLGLLAEPETLPLFRDVLLSDEPENAYEYQTHAIAALIKLGSRHAELRTEIAEILRKRAEDPGWKIESRLKGTESDFKRMDPVFRVRIAAVLKSWGEEHRIAEAMAEMKLDAYERFLKERWA